MELATEQRLEPARENCLQLRFEEVEQQLEIMRAAFEKTQAAVERLELSRIQQEVLQGRLLLKVQELRNAQTPLQILENCYDGHMDGPTHGICNDEPAKEFENFGAAINTVNNVGA